MRWEKRRVSSNYLPPTLAPPGAFLEFSVRYPGLIQVLISKRNRLLCASIGMTQWPMRIGCQQSRASLTGCCRSRNGNTQPNQRHARTFILAIWLPRSTQITMRSHNDYLSTDSITRGETLPVGSFQPNEFGLHDLHGNVFEWTEDCWHENYERAPRNGQAWTTGGDCSLRVIRGGSWFNHAGFMRSANRSRAKVDTRYTHYGLRVARAINPISLAAQLELAQSQAGEQ